MLVIYNNNNNDDDDDDDDDDYILYIVNSFAFFMAPHIKSFFNLSTRVMFLQINAIILWSNYILYMKKKKK